jgi:hypothetical protein
MEESSFTLMFVSQVYSSILNSIVRLCKGVATMPWSHEGATQKINSIKEEFNWNSSRASRFHDWLESSYPGEKEEMSFTRLREVAREFMEQDKETWKDSYE